LLNVVVHSADVQDRDGAPLVLDRCTRRLFPFIEHIFADPGYQGPKAAAAIARTGTWKFEIIKRNELRRFVVLPKRWIVERALARFSHNLQNKPAQSFPAKNDGVVGILQLTEVLVAVALSAALVASCIGAKCDVMGRGEKVSGDYVSRTIGPILGF
jgi:putative transposase